MINNRRTRIALSLVVTMAILLLAGCGEQKKEQVHLIVKTPALSGFSVRDPEIESADEFLKKIADAFVAQYKKADVTIDIVSFSQTVENKAITDCFDTEYAVDVLYEGYFNMATYIHTGRVEPLDDIITDGIRTDIPESNWTISQVGGKTYMMPFLSLQNIMSYNKDLFREVGLEAFISDKDEIQTWTLEEWEMILDTLAERLPVGKYPMMMYAENDQGDTHIMTLLRSHGSDFFDEKGKFNLNTEAGIAALQWLKDGNDKGWFPPLCENLEIIDAMNLFSNGQLALCVSNNAFISAYPNLDIGYVNFPSQSGDGYATSFVKGFEVFDNGDEMKVTVGKDFVKFIYENEEWMDYSAGGIPVSSRVTEKFKDQIFMLDAFQRNNKNVVDFTANNPNWRGVRAAFFPHIQDLLRGDKTAAEVAAELDADCNAAIEAGYRNSILHQ